MRLQAAIKHAKKTRDIPENLKGYRDRFIVELLVFIDRLAKEYIIAAEYLPTEHSPPDGSMYGNAQDFIQEMKQAGIEAFDGVGE